LCSVGYANAIALASVVTERDRIIARAITADPILFRRQRQGHTMPRHYSFNTPVCTQSWTWIGSIHGLDCVRIFGELCGLDWVGWLWPRFL